MPLSEEELRLLEQMERHLVEEDPKLASTLRGTPFRRAARRRAALFGVAFIVGVVLLMTGAITAQWWIGVVGFVVMLGSATLVVTSLRHPGSAAPEPTKFDESHRGGFSVIDGGRRERPARPSRSSRPRAARGHSSFMDRMEERWRRRREGF